MAKAKRQAIIVLGMHRSGTSALAGALGALGMRLPAQLLPTTADNPKGYFESDRIVAIHDRLLTAAGTSWFGIESLPADWLRSKEASAFVDELIAAVRQDFGDASTFVVKDPRMCRLMPLWRQVLDKVGAQARFAIPLRNPLEVARSLEKRDGLPLAHGCLLWLGHMLEAEHETRGSRRVFVQYHDLLSDPVGIAAHVASQLAEKEPALNQETKTKISSLIDPKLRHHKARPKDLQLDDAFYPWLWEAYKAFDALVERPADKASQRRLDGVRVVFDRAVASFVPILAARDNRLLERDAEIFALNQTLAEHHRHLAGLGQAVTNRDSQIVKLGQIITERDGKIDSLNQTVIERDGQIADLGKAAAKREEQIASLAQTATEIGRQVTIQASQLEEIYSSTIWRFLAPLRWYGRLRQGTGSSAGRRSDTLRAAEPDSFQQSEPQPVDQSSPLPANETPAPVHSPPSPYRCSLVIPTKNGGDLFKQVVDGLRTQTCWKNVEFIVVDSGSTDDTVSIARSAGAIVRSIPPQEFNHGSTRDYGISLASTDHVILLVQDAVPHNNVLIERLLSALAEDGVAGAYARQLPQPTADVITKRDLNSWLTGGLVRKIKVMKSLDWYESLPPTERYFFCNFDNVCSAINKRVWKEEKFGRADFGEDIDWAERVLKRKFKIIYEPGAAVIHSHNRSALYNYKRTYICHRVLYRKFGLHLVPSLRALWPAWLESSKTDMLLSIRMEKSIGRKLRLLLTIPANNLLMALGQYRAVRDEMRGIGRKMRGV